jgi:hypothetical protein
MQVQQLLAICVFQLSLLSGRTDVGSPPFACMKRSRHICRIAAQHHRTVDAPVRCDVANP